MSTVETITNGQIELSVSSHGAEMISVKKLPENEEYLWNGDGTFWGRHAPMLFPFVGSVRNTEYRYDGKTYSMGQHGFARDMEWELTEKTADSLTYALEDTEETREKYPFAFRLTVTYTLQGDEIAYDWKVENPGEKNLYFSIGGHPAFLCPMEKAGGQWKDYKIYFAKNGKALEKLDVHYIGEGGCVNHGSEELPLENGGLLTPSAELFARDALIIEDRQADEVALVSPKGNHYLTVNFDTPLFGIWSPVGKTAPFICIEPWNGRADFVDFTGSLEERTYGNTLAPGEIFRSGYRFTLATV